nr:PfkB family carbohydrate kinase [uncultured Agathobaculum sp.]
MSWQDTLRARRQQARSKRITVGFDGFADTIVRPLRQAATAGQDAQPFETIRAFGEFLISKAEKSCSVELAIEARQLGGNLPFLSRAAGGLGADVTCIGMLGEPGMIDPLFATMPCALYSFAAPGQSTCMEFNDGKVLLASDCTLPGDPWQCIMDATGGKAPDLFRQADLIALVNWSELSFADALWQRVLDVVVTQPADKARFAFFDLCDVSRKASDELDAVLRRVGAFSGYRTAVLSLNENEALVTAERLLYGQTDPAEIAQAVRAAYGIDEVIVHTIHKSILVTPRGVTQQATDFVEHPRISTGAGDNFNGASCFAAVMGLPDDERIAFANAFAHRYVSTGRNPTLDELL